MKTIQLMILKFSVIIFFIFSTLAVSNARELNTESFSGTVNTTVTSGFTMRASDRECEQNFGMTYTSVVAAYGTVTTGNGAGCSKFRTDNYGNLSTEFINMRGSNPNSDDGNLNFDNTEIVNATQKFYTEVIGNTNGFGINLSLTGSYNPVNSISTPHFKKLKPKALKEQEQDLSLLNAYVTTEFDTGNNYIDLTIGRSVTSWGEATFIPVTMNGLVTNALDLTKLRAPGSSIKEALIPTEQIVLASNVDGIGIEAYYQFSDSQVKLDAAGTFFGSEVAGTGETGLIVGGAYGLERAGNNACPYELTLGVAANCTAAVRDVSMASDAYSVDTYLDEAFELAGLSAAAVTGDTFGQGASAGFTVGGSLALSSIVAARGLDSTTTAGSAYYGAGSQALFTAALQRAGAKVHRPKDRVAGLLIGAATDGKHKNARDDGQFGIKLSTYVDQAGGIDLSFFYANYHSKTPYLRIKGMQGLFAGDLHGLFRVAAFDQLDSNFAPLAGGTTEFTDGSDGAYGTIFTGSTYGQNLIKAIQEVAYGGVTCSAVLGNAMAAAQSGGALSGATGSVSSRERAAFMNAFMSVAMDGEARRVHNPTACGTFAAGANLALNANYSANFVALGGTSTNKANSAADVNLALMGTAAHILAAITPVNYMEYDFIYPEDNQIFGSSFSTVVDGTVLQGEISYRPDFPLATNGGSQVNQMLDAVGTTQSLNWLAHNGLNAVGSSATAVGDAGGDGLQAALATQMLAAGGSAAYTTTLRDFKRSSLNAISVATVNAGDFYSTPFLKYDVWSADIGTTSAFNASHPLTVTIGADSAVFLTELAAVHIPNLNNANGYVARGGFSEGGDSPEKCLGAFGTSHINTAAVGVTNIGAGQVDGLFGNGAYCETNPGAGETSYTYRLIGSATYNNFANSSWAIKPNFAWSHDPSGYGPSSLGGFVEGRMSLALGLGADNGAVSASLSYVNQMGDMEANSQTDKDTISASVSYAF